jgi:Type II secretion system (T2SS), protein M
MALVDRLIDQIRDSAAGDYLARAQAFISPQYRQLRNRYYKLDKRERLMLKLAGAALGVFLLYSFIWSPIVSYQSDLEDEIVARQQDLTDVRRMTVIYRRLQTELTTLEKNTAPSGSDFSLPSTLSTALNGAVETDKIAGISNMPDKPISNQFIQHSAGLRLTGVSLTQLVDVLYRIKTIRVPVVVSDLSIKKHGADPHAFDVDMTCSVLGKNA